MILAVHFLDYLAKRQRFSEWLVRVVHNLVKRWVELDLLLFFCSCYVCSGQGWFWTIIAVECLAVTASNKSKCCDVERTHLSSKLQ